ncbi:glycolate oxidase subunit GlcF [Crenobacter sp. SG2303]|uniref:Glycolate oxidase iron-sulfur subunit n=1 Tax=Crenobacter oryzisoli TaxID=3056844 RepID=A0ABT7XU48_9NEIS|nr:glycolate oxidase subunit GlcF [Crenobacter sp. SG2303]MDN0077079.1 glycolate oxidase subunit GlcF [Crenobacter sp. SG2303]
MQTNLADFIKGTPEGSEAERILGKCVHCGFCTATCPTYQLLGDELDGPRGRIYLIKQVVEGATPTAKTLSHLDRCLTCRNCESTCPSGVEYGKLLDVGRHVIEAQVGRSFKERMQRRLLAKLMTSPAMFGTAYRFGQQLRPLLPPSLKAKVLPAKPAGVRPTRQHARKVLMLEGCVQPAMQPNINNATLRVLDTLGIEAVSPPAAGCCGAVRYHLNEQDAALDDMRRNIDAWWPHLDQGAEAIVINASGCGVTVKEYGYYLRNDPAYAVKAARVSELACDIVELLAPMAATLAERVRRHPLECVAYHPPCTLQHGQRVRGRVEALLQALGLVVMLPADSHLCCGSAGTYSVLQPALSYRLRDNKLAALAQTQPQAIVSANIGCIGHLQSGTATPVMHWIELVDRMLAESASGSS